jgi:hypothetical protein
MASATASLFVKAPAVYYVFFSFIEIGATSAVVWLAWRWKGEGLINRQSV